MDARQPTRSITRGSRPTPPSPRPTAPATPRCACTVSGPIRPRTGSSTRRRATRRRSSAPGSARTAAGSSPPSSMAGRARTSTSRISRSPKPEWRPLVVGVDARYDVTVDGDRFFVWTNEGASRYRVFRVDPTHPARDQWKEVVAERPDATLEAVSVVGHRLSLGYLKDVVSHLELRDEDGKLVREIRAPDARVGLGPERRGRRRRRVLLVQLVHLSDRDLRDERQERRDVDVLQAQGPGGPVEVRGRAALRDEQGRDEDPVLRRAREGPREDGQHARDALRVRRLPGGADAGVLVVDLSRGSRTAASGRSPTSAAAASTARSGTGRGCATRSSTCSTTTSPSPRSS